MADLAGRMVVAIHEPVVQQHRRADAPGDLHKQAVGIAVPEEVVGEQRGVRVVVHSGRQRELAFEHVAKLHVVPAEIGTGDHPPRAGDHAGNRQAGSSGPQARVHRRDRPGRHHQAHVRDAPRFWPADPSRHRSSHTGATDRCISDEARPYRWPARCPAYHGHPVSSTPVHVAGRRRSSRRSRP